MMALRWLALAGALLAGAAQAQEGLPDPTRPPAVMSAPAASLGQAPVSSAPQVQSILISLRPGGRRIAVIDGKMLREGGRVGGAVLEAIRPTEVVLRKGTQRQVLKLFRPAARAAAI